MPSAPDERMVLEDVERPTRLDERAGGRRPPVDVGQPAQRPDPRVDDVVGAPRQGRDRVVHVGADELGVDALGVGERARAASTADSEKSSPVTARAAPRPRQGVEAEVALEVQQLASGDVTDLLDLDRPQCAPAGTEAVDVVELRRNVQRGALVPLPPVHLHRLGLGHVVHGAMMARPADDRTDIAPPCNRSSSSWVSPAWGRPRSGAWSPTRSTFRSSTPTTSTATPPRRRCMRASRSPTPSARRGSTGSTARSTSTRRPVRCSRARR